MKNYFLITVLFFLLSLQAAFAGKEKMNSRLNSAQIVPSGVVAVSDSKFPNITMGGSAVIANSTGKLTLGLDNYASTLNYFGTPIFNLKVKVSVTYSTTSGSLLNQTVDLIIDHNSASAAINTDKSIVVFKNAHILVATIVSVTDISNNTPSIIPSNLYLEAEVETDRYYKLDVANSNTLLSIPVANHFFDAATNELQVYWNSVTGAEEYELEWTYVNNFDISAFAYAYTLLSSGLPGPTTPMGLSTMPASNIDFTFLNNATRIRTSKNDFRISQNYDRGFIVYRVRAIGRDIAATSFEVIGKWSLEQPQTTPSFKLSGLGTFNNFFLITSNAHEENKNWQYTATYAEDGKKKEVIGYFDGSLRKRQTVTKTNSENISLIGETMYDSQGRAAVEVLPSPDINYSPFLKYYENFNQSQNIIVSGFHAPYNKVDFESSTSTCPAPSDPMFTGNLGSGANGAAVYYSPNNTNKENQQAYLPNSQQFPFTKKIYTPDNTGRVKYQTGVGPDHQIGSTHETKYLYGDPDQEDLDKLFGSEAGFAERYKKNMVIDPNGQISISYLNTEDKVVATALAGNNPNSVNAISSTVLQSKNVSYMDYNDANYDVVNYIDNGAVVFKKKIIPDFSGPYNFTYELTVPQFNDVCIPGFCYDCVYDLEITLKDECNLPVFSTVIAVGFNSSNVIDYTCASQISITSGGWVPAFSAGLIAGKEYFLTKTLSVNKIALSDYLSHYITTATTNNCVKDLSDFVSDENVFVDLTGCNISCPACVAYVNSYYTLHSNAAKADPNDVTNYDPNYIYMSPTQYQLAIDACEAPCKPTTLCQVEFDQMLQDVRPKGQYAGYDVSNTGIYDASSYELSIFNTGPGNFLRISTIAGFPEGSLPNASATTGTPFVPYNLLKYANWKNPEFYNRSTHNFTSPTGSYTKEHYFNVDGTISKIRIIPSGSNYIPAIVNASPTFTFTDNLGVWTYPENLANLKDFVAAYSNNANWAYSLVKFHPEFNYFLDCDRQGNPNFGTLCGTKVMTSEDFDNELRTTSTYAAAISLTGKCWAVSNNSNSINDPDELINKDPYFNNLGPGVGLKGAFLSRLSPYQGTGKSVKELAAEMYSTANMFSCTACSAVFGQTSYNCCLVSLTLPTTALDEEWKIYREIYLAEKAKIIMEEAHNAACKTYTTNSLQNNYYNGAIGDPNFSPFFSYANYTFWPFIPVNSPYPFFAPFPSVPFFWPNYTGGQVGFPGNVSGFSFYQPSPIFPKTGRGFYDFGCPSSYYHKGRYAQKIKRVPDLQTLSNSLAGGASSLTDIGNAINQTAQNDIYFATGQCPIFKKLELFLAAIAKNGKLTNFNTIIPLVSEPAFTHDVYDAIIGANCAGYASGTWYPLAIKPLPPSGPNNITIEFYNMTTGSPVYINGIDIVLDGTNIPNWSNVVSFSSFNYNGIVAGKSAFTMKALYNTGASLPYVQYLVTGSTCIKSNCTPPPSQQCKPTQQAYALQSFLSAVMLDNTPTLQSSVNLGDLVTSSAQFFTQLLKYPYTTPVALLPNPVTHSVILNPNYLQMRIEGQSPCSAAGITVTFNFTPIGPITVPTLQNALGFSNITPNQGTGPYDFTVKALYSSTSSQLFGVNIVYSNNACCTDAFNAQCRRYKITDCTPYVPSSCNNNGYNSAIQFLSFLNEVKDYPFSGGGFNLPLFSSFTPLLQSQIGQNATFVTPNIVNVLSTSGYEHTLSINFNSISPTINLCKINATFTLSYPLGSNISTYTFKDFTVLNPPSGQFSVTLTDGVNNIDVFGDAPCLTMQNCGPCVSSNIIFEEHFEDPPYNNSTPVSAFNFVNQFVKSGPITTGNYIGFNTCVSAGTPVFGDYSIYHDSYSPGCTGYTNNTFGGEQFLDAYIDDGPNPPVTDYFEIWKTKTNVICSPGKKYDFSCYFRSPVKPPSSPNFYKIELIVNDGTNNFVIASEIVNYLFPAWKKLAGSWTATSTNLSLKVKLSPYIITLPTFQTHFDAEVSLDDIVITELNCGSESVYSLPPAVPQNDCANQLNNIGLSNALAKYNLYIDNVKKDFTDRYNKTCYKSLEKLQAAYQTREGHYTLYYYDQGGNLIKTVPPEGVEPLNLSAIEPITGLTYANAIKQDRLNKTHKVITNHRMATRYEYNSLNQLIRQQMPDHDNTDLWTTQNNTGLPTNMQGSAMDFSDNSRGYIVGNDGTNGVIYITNNGGASWSPASALGIGDIIDVDVAGGVDAFALISDGTILKSSNYTAPVPSWATITLPGSNLMQFTDIEFATPLIGYITGKNGLLLQTIDGGINWTNLTISTANFNKIKFKPSGASYYGILVGDQGTIYYTTPANFGTWTAYTLINTAIDITNVEIIDVSSLMDVMLTAVDKNSTPYKGTAIKIDNVDGASGVNAVFSVPSTFNTSLSAITYTAYVSGTNNVVDVFVGGAVNLNTPVMYKLQAVNTNPFVATAISVTPSANNSITDLKVNGFISGGYEIYGSMKNGQLLHLNSANIAATALNLNTIGTNVNVSKLNNIWIDPTATNSGLIVGNAGTNIRFTVNSGPSVVSSNPNVVPYPFLNAVTAAKDGSGKVYAVGASGSVIRSNNFGASWQPFNANVPVGVNLTSALYVAAATPSVYMGGDQATIVEVDVVSNIPLTVYNTNTSSKQYNCITRNPNNLSELFIAGKDNTNDALIQNFLMTAPGANPSGIFASSLYKTVNKLIFATNANVFAACDQGSLLNSTTNGSSPYNLVTLTPSTFNDLKDVSFTDYLTGYIFGAANTIYKTTDGGLTWNQKPAPAGSNINAVYNFGNGNLLATGNTNPNLFNVNDQSNDYSTRFYYDALGRLVISQNVKQFNKPSKAYSYTIYDALGRISEVGEISGGLLPDPGTLANVNGVIDLSVFNSWLSFGNHTEVTFTKYDAPVTNPCSFTQDNLRKRVSATYLDNDGNLTNGYQHATYYTYDIHGNVSSLMQENPLMPVGHTCKVINYQYDLISGKVNQVNYQPGQLDAYSHKYEYDADNRITNVYTSKDGFNWQQDAKYFYYLHGPLARTELGNDKIQGLDYAYTLQGWIKGTNSTIINENNDIGKDGAPGTLYNSTQSGLHDFVTKDAASFSLNYFNNDYTAIDATKNTAANRFDASVVGNPHMSVANNWLYNGNISAMVTTINEGVGGPKPQLTAYKYDQLNRLNTVSAYRNISANAWSGGAGNEYRNEFTYDANGNILNQKRYNDAGVQEDDLVYQYHVDGATKKHSNRLYHVNDIIGVTATTADIEDQGIFTPAPLVGKGLGAINTANNYSYDQIGNLIKDAKENISNIDWTVYGKIKKIERITSNTADDNHVFEYDAAGNRVSKTQYTNGQPANTWKTTYYVRDAQGNVMATYEYKPAPTTQKLYFIEHPVYGSSRAALQTYQETNNLDATSAYNTSTPIYTVSEKTGLKYFELSNHLGNVITVVTDKKDPVQGAPTIVDYFQPNVISASDYYAFGMQMPGRQTASNLYRYGFNGKEKDDEVKGDGNSMDFGARIYDTRLGRFLSRDPKFSLSPWQSPFSYSSDSPIFLLDPDGNWDIEVHAFADRTKYGFGIAIVKDNAGKEVYRTTVRLQGAAGSDRFATDNDTPTGVYKMSGWGNYSKANRVSYGPNSLMVMTPESGQIKETGRSGIWMHGGRQETFNKETGKYEPIDNPQLKKTHGCLRAYDASLLELKTITDNLEANDPNEAPGKTTVTDDLINKNGGYYSPEDITNYSNKLTAAKNNVTKVITQAIKLYSEGKLSKDQLASLGNKAVETLKKEKTKAKKELDDKSIK